MSKISVVVTLSHEEREELESRASSADEWISQRAKMILYAVMGMSNKAIAEKLGVSERVVSKWRKRFAEDRLEGLNESLGRGRKVALSGSNLKTLLETVYGEMKEGSYLPLRTLQEKLSKEHQIDVPIATLQRTLTDYDRSQGSWQESREAEFGAKWMEIIGLCISPPHHALLIRRKDFQTYNYSEVALESKAIDESSFSHRNDPQSLLLAFMVHKSFGNNQSPQKTDQKRDEEFIKYLEDLQKSYPGEKLSMVYVDTSKRNDNVAKWLHYQSGHIENLSVASMDSWMSVVEIQLNLLTRVMTQKGMYAMDSGKVHITSRDIISKVLDHIKEYSEDGKHFGWAHVKE